MRRVLGLVAVLSLFAVNQIEASQIWVWSFAGETGQFVTSGSAPTPGVYSLEDFLVTTSAVGGTLGSLTGGQYSPSGFATTLPYDMTWDGLAVTFWASGGSNSFDWWVFSSVVPDRYYFFGWDTGNLNDPGRAAYYSSALGIDNPIAVGDVTVRPYEGGPTTVPDAGSSLLLLGMSFAGLRAWKQRVG
jgi:hypothetical protein